MAFPARLCLSFGFAFLSETAFEDESWEFSLLEGGLNIKSM